jgi:hypothetical protein
MTEHLIERLRSFSTYVGYESIDGAYEMASVCQQAADEIERLRGLGDLLVVVMKSGSDTGWDYAIDKWEKDSYNDNR